MENKRALFTTADLLSTTERRIGTPYFIVPSYRECIVKNAEGGNTWFAVRQDNLPRGKYGYPKQNICAGQ